MPTLEAVPTLADLTLTITDEIRVAAPLATTFAALLEQLGPGNERPDGVAMPFTLEAFPGGRWFRDLGNGDGHCWGTVQAIKRNSLLEISGPLFMSYPVSNNIQYRLSEEGGETVIRFHHTAFGLIADDHRKNVTTGWSFIHQQAKKRAEASSK
jgi:hypothetical protein